MSSDHAISIIIPVVNEAENLRHLLPFLNRNKRPSDEVIVSIGKSTDQSSAVAFQNGVTYIENDIKCRAIQMNLAASKAKNDVLYFLHADSIPPISFINDIINEIEEGKDCGCFRFKFNSKNIFLKVNSFFTRFDKLWCRGGDQSLFIKKEVWDRIGKFNESYSIMEDFEYIERVQANSKFTIIPKDILVSDRKYKYNGYLKVQIANLLAFSMYKWGYPQSKLKRVYNTMLNLYQE